LAGGDPSLGCGVDTVAMKTSTAEYHFAIDDSAETTAAAFVDVVLPLLTGRTEDTDCIEPFILAEEERLRERLRAAAQLKTTRARLGTLGDVVFGDESEAATWAGDGVRKGAKGLATGVLAGMSDIVIEGKSGVRKDGTRGLVFGVARGLGTLGQNTAVGVAGLVKNTAEGVKATPTMALSITAGVSGAVDNLKESGMHAPRLHVSLHFRVFPLSSGLRLSLAAAVSFLCG
jgi:hypothetical protein